ncbi:exodeoxyribonuclease III [soil metagenome]
MRIATWNVNSVNARLATVVEWLETAQPDVVCMQEIKTVDEKFPREDFERLGYNIETHGQKSYNGVAILSKYPMSDVRRGLPGAQGAGIDGADDDQARYIEAVIEAPVPVRVGAIYLPNGNPVATGKFPYKLAWLERLRAHARTLLTFEEPLVLCGDYNVIPTPADAKNPQNWVGDALFQPQSQAAFRALKYLGLSEAGELGEQPPGTFTFWDYQAGAWQRDNGIRIDFHLLSPQAADRFRGVETHRDARDMDKPSDHVPVVIDLNLETPASGAGRLAA